MSGPTSPSGWYEDPHQAGRKRWWNGSAWTDHAVDASGAPVDAPMPRPAPASPREVKQRMAQEAFEQRHGARAVAIPAAPNPNRTLITWGWITIVIGALFWPLMLAPFVIGIILAARGEGGHGAAMIVLSIVLPVVVFFAGCAAIVDSVDEETARAFIA